MKEVDLLYEFIKGNHSLVMDAIRGNHTLEEYLLIGVGFMLLLVVIILFQIGAIVSRMNTNKEIFSSAVTLITNSNQNISKAIVTLTDIVKKLEMRDQIIAEQKRKK